MCLLTIHHVNSERLQRCDDHVDANVKLVAANKKRICNKLLKKDFAKVLLRFKSWCICKSLYVVLGLLKLSRRKYKSIALPDSSVPLRFVHKSSIWIVRHVFLQLCTLVGQVEALWDEG